MGIDVFTEIGKCGRKCRESRDAQVINLNII